MSPIGPTNPIDPIVEILDGGPLRNLAAVRVVLELGCAVLKTVFHPKAFEEEPITSALSGAFAADSSWILALAPKKPERAPSMFWGQYKKNRLSQHASGKIKTETESGADFALLIRTSARDALLAIFQAKKTQTDNATEKFVSVRLGRRASKVGEAESQYQRLANHGCFLLAQLHGDEQVANPRKLDWIHYLIYRDQGPNVVSFAQVDKGRARLLASNSQQVEQDPHIVRISYDHLLPIERLVDLGEASTHQPVQIRGWLTLTVEQAKRYVPGLRDLTGAELYIADDAMFEPMVFPEGEVLRLTSEPPAKNSKPTLREHLLDRALISRAKDLTEFFPATETPGDAPAKPEKPSGSRGFGL